MNAREVGRNHPTTLSLRKRLREEVNRMNETVNKNVRIPLKEARKKEVLKVDDKEAGKLY